ncbi:hypothetical protein ACFFKH_19690 [Micromonospora marina]|uniref:hypothetical protein n=1 Tax=Micromonospora marina TaxID=307120 RepID=UPI00114CF8BB|nr:hypothetical protein [Micromonospora marina]
MVIAAPHVSLSPGGRMLALFCHLTCLVMGFGAVLTVDWFSLRWLLRREPLDAVLNAARGAHPLIWLPGRSRRQRRRAGTGHLIRAGTGQAARGARGRRQRGAPRPALTSQLGWWTATLIGFLNAHS